jgi:hypothetical protein
LVKGHLEVEFPPLIKLRLAHRDEIAAHAAEDADFDIQEGVRVVYLRQLGSPAD